MSDQSAEKPWPLDWMPAYLAALRNSGNVRASAQAAGITRQMALKARNKWKAFADAHADAMEDAIDTLEAAAWQRARQQSDYLLWRLLAANRKDKYGDTVKVTLDLEAEARKIAEREGLPPEEATKIVSIAQHLQKGKTG